jgi:hypothetical protein
MACNRDIFTFTFTTVTLRVIEDDKKGIPCLGGYNRATLSLGDINTDTETWSPMLGVGRRADDLSL